MLSNQEKALMTELTGLFDIARENAAIEVLREVEETTAEVLAGVVDDGEVVTVRVDAMIDRTQVHDGCVDIYLSEHVRLSVALTADFLVPVEDVIAEFEGSDHVWRAVSAAEIHEGSFIWHFCEHIASEVLASTCSLAA